MACRAVSTILSAVVIGPRGTCSACCLSRCRLYVTSVTPPPPDPCTVAGGADVAPGDVFTSPNNPGNYPRNANCQWNLVCPTGTPTLTFSSFNLENNWDYVRLDTNGDGSTDTDATGTTAPAPGVAYAVVLDTDGSVNRAGFSGSFTCA